MHAHAGAPHGGTEERELESAEEYQGREGCGENRQRDEHMKPVSVERAPEHERTGAAYRHGHRVEDRDSRDVR